MPPPTIATLAAGAVPLHPGMICAEPRPTLVSTVLGSCVAVCLWDPQLRVGGINHYVLPLWNGEGLASPRFGNIAIEKLLERLAGLGCQRTRLRAKVFGGGALIGTSPGLLNVGERNVTVADDLLARAGIAVAARDVGGGCSRKVIFNTESGEVFLRRLEVRRG